MYGQARNLLQVVHIEDGNEKPSHAQAKPHPSQATRLRHGAGSRRTLSRHTYDSTAFKDCTMMVLPKLVYLYVTMTH